MPTGTENTDQENLKTPSKNWWRLLKNIIVGLLFLFFLLFILTYFLVKSERFQNWAIDKVSNHLSESLNTTVHVDHIDLQLFNKLTLEGFYVADEDGDTLLYSKFLKTNLSSNLFSLLNQEVDIDEIYLDDAQFNLIKRKGRYDDNLQFILDYLSPKDNNKKKGNPFFLNIDALYLTNVRFLKDDVPGGQSIYVHVPKGKVDVDSINIDRLYFGIDGIEIETPLVEIKDKERFPLPAKEEIEEENEADAETGIAIQDSIEKVLLVEVNSLKLIDGIVNVDNYRHSPAKTKPDHEIDFSHLHIHDIQIQADSLQFTDYTLSGMLNQLSIKESAFELENLMAKDAKLSSRRIELNDCKLITANSEIGDTIILKYRKFNDFGKINDKVLWDARLDNAKVSFHDIMVFFPVLEDNAFFSRNRTEILEIDGQLKGKINNLRGKNLNVKLGQNTYFTGDFSSRDLAVRHSEMLNLNVKQLRTDIKTLRLLVPNFDLPTNYDRLGNLVFSGRFDGFFVDFVANGDLSTDLGSAIMNMRLDLKPGLSRASYAGMLSLIDFDLGTLTGDKNLDKITFTAEVKDGVGLSHETMNANIKTKIKNFSYKGYKYDNVAFSGILNETLLDGDLIIKDDNVDLAFNGNIEIIDSIPVMDFKAEVNKLDLYALNLSKEKLVFTGDVDFKLKDIKISTMQGRAAAYNVKIQHNDTSFYQVDSMIVISELKPNRQRYLNVDSEILKGYVNGQYEITEVPEALLQFFEKNYPEFAERLKIKSKGKQILANQFDFDINIIETKNLNQLINPKLDSLEGMNLTGSFNSFNDSLYAELDISKLHYDNVKFNEIFAKADALGSNSVIDISVFDTKINDKIALAPITLLGFVNRDTIEFGVSAINFSEVFDNLNLNGHFFLEEDDAYNISFSNSNLIILNDLWSIEENNYLRFGKRFVEAKNFEFENDDRSISIESINENGLSLNLENFHLGFIDSLWRYNKLDFGGHFNVSAEVGNVFTLEDFSAVAEADSFFINKDDFGKLRLDAEMKNINSPINSYLTITKGIEQLTAEGTYRLPNAKVQPNYFDFDINIYNYPLSIAEYWLSDGLSNTVGQFDSKVNLYGLPKKPNIDGWLRIFDAALTVDYLQTRYQIRNDTARISNYFIDATGGKLRDSLNNIAVITGGIRHNHLKEFTLDVRADSEQFLFLNTEKKDNEIYYGKGIGKGSVIFTGDFQKPDILVDATTGPTSKIIIPISYETETSELSFIKFVDKNKSRDSKDLKKKTDLRGVNLDMTMHMTEDAEVWMIFDEKAGDIIKSKGVGDMQFEVTRDGDFRMYGNYVVEEGDYLFTLYNVVNKPFEIKQGGTISWTGDPFGAKINLTAEYKDMSASPYYFIQEYVENTDDQNLKEEARKPTKVDLTMNLKGDLLSPEIDFDLGFPSVTGEIKNFTDGKLRTVRQDQNELNRQIFGLLVIGGFLPSGNIEGSQLVTGINTLTELLSNQLSIYLTELLSEVFTDIGFISGIDFDIAYNVYTAEGLNAGSTGGPVVSTGSEFQLRLKNYLFNDRLSINLGSNIGSGSAEASNDSGSYIAGDVVIEYVLTRDRRFKVRFYQSTQSTSLQGGRSTRQGIGISYRREFDHFINGMKKTAKRMIE